MSEYDLQDLERRLLAEQEHNRILLGRIETMSLDALYIKDCIRDGLSLTRNNLNIIAAQVDAAAKILYELEQRVFPNTIPPAHNHVVQENHESGLATQEPHIQADENGNSSSS